MRPCQAIVPFTLLTSTLLGVSPTVQFHQSPLHHQPLRYTVVQWCLLCRSLSQRRWSLCTWSIQSQSRTIAIPFLGTGKDIGKDSCRPSVCYVSSSSNQRRVGFNKPACQICQGQGQV